MTQSIVDSNYFLAAAEESDSPSEDDDESGSSDDDEGPRYQFRGLSTRLADLVAAQDGSFPAFGDRDNDSSDDDDDEPRYRFTEFGWRCLKWQAEFGVEVDEEWRGTTDKTATMNLSATDLPTKVMTKTKTEMESTALATKATMAMTTSILAVPHQTTIVTLAILTNQTTTMTRVTALLREIFREYANNRPSRIPEQLPNLRTLYLEGIRRQFSIAILVSRRSTNALSRLALLLRFQATKHRYGFFRGFSTMWL